MAVAASDLGAHVNPPYKGDIDVATFRRAAHRVADMAADYLESVHSYRVTPKVAPGEVRARIAASPPETGESLDTILDDYASIIQPNVTHWNHPGFFAYFANTGSVPGILGEWLTATLNVNTMLWKTGPASTELEEVACDWLRQMVGLPEHYWGYINDTASINTLLSLVAARHRLKGAKIRERGLAGRTDLQPLVIYTSEHAHVSVDKAAITLGFGLENLRRIQADDEFRMDVAALETAVDRDRTAGRTPVAVIATAGTTSTTSVDPLDDIAALCEREGMWCHVDAAYAGSAAICPEYRALLSGIDRADSVIVNPHKWLFTPSDCSVLFLKDRDELRNAISVVPEYLRSGVDDVTNLMEYGVQLGRRFRALKLWMVLRAYGVTGLQDRIRYHCGLAQALARRIDGAPLFERMAPVPFSVVCFRATPAVSPGRQDRFNERLLEMVNADGSVFLSSTRLHDRVTLRVAIGNVRTAEEDVERAWTLLSETATRLVHEGGW